MVSIKVCYKENGKPVKGVEVLISFDGFLRGTSKGYTDSDGNADMDVSPGSGTIYTRGKTVHKGRIEGRTVVYI